MRAKPDIRCAPAAEALPDRARTLALAIEAFARRLREAGAPARLTPVIEDLARSQAELRRRLGAAATTDLDLLRLDRAISVLIAAVDQAPAPSEIADLASVRQLRRQARGLSRRLKLALAASSVLALLAARPAAAACNPFVNVLTCNGSVGAVVAPDPLNPLTWMVNTVEVGGLTADIAPASGTVGVSLTNGGGVADDGDVAFDGDNGTTPTGLMLTFDGVGHSLTVANAIGVYVASQGQAGGEGGIGLVLGSAGDGGAGGNGGTITGTVAGTVLTAGDLAIAFAAVSSGGNGGDGGDLIGIAGVGGDGGTGGSGGAVALSLGPGRFQTNGLGAFGVFAASRGGTGGDSGSCASLFCASSAGGISANGGTVGVSALSGLTVETYGSVSDALHVTSVGGFAGGGGDSYALLGFGTSGGSAGNGGDVTVDNAAILATHGQISAGVFAQSVGGGGGAGGSSYGIVSLGGGGAVGGAGGAVSVTNRAAGQITTLDMLSRGIFAQSVGGGGGSAGNGGGVVAIGGGAANASNGGAVTVVNAGQIHTSGVQSEGIYAQSVGGGGGDGGVGGGLVAIGGGGGGGGNGAKVTVSNSGGVATAGDDSMGVFAQSVGGGGGSGGTTGGVVTVGASGGDGGDGDDVEVTNTGTITTHGERAVGLYAQSVGGGGGDGGGAGSGGVFFNVSVGGAGGIGGNAGDVTVVNGPQATVQTAGAQAAGIYAQSVGGGGGTGGFAAGASVGLYFDASVGVGGSGGGGGNAGEVMVTAGGDIDTAGADSQGIFAQSIGGGGGTGGFAATGAASAGSVAVSASVGVGGDGGVAGDADRVNVTSTARIRTVGDRATGIYVQAVGGGGGSGGWTGALGGAAGSVAGGVGVSIGGDGGAGGNGAPVVVTVSAGRIQTSGVDASGILAQSVGGGGGTGGFSLAAAVGAGNAAAGAGVAVGGDGGTAGRGDAASLTNHAAITTLGDRSYGAQVQSIGGGGGTGGWTGVVAVGAGNNSGSGSVGVGGDGGAGGNGAAATLINTGAISTKGVDASGLYVQSVGGGGGSGGFSLSVGVAQGKNTGGASVTVGGDGGAAGGASLATLTNSGAVSTAGDRAYGLQAQSIGGGGGSGGWTGALGAAIGNNGATAAVGVGGDGGAGGDGGKVVVNNTGALSTQGVDASGLLAQSIGGGGGTGGFSLAIGAGVVKNGGGAAVNVGGAGGAAGGADTVTVTTSGDIATLGDRAGGAVAQSIGGGGGTGGWTGSLSADLGSNGGAVSVGVGGDGGGGGDGAPVSLTARSGAISTKGVDAPGLMAQSVGGGGGAGGFSLAVAAAKGDHAAAFGLALGGDGGVAGNGAAVTLVNRQAITTLGDRAYGAVAQSLGGGGGSGGFSGVITGAMAKQGGAVSIGLGGDGGAGGSGGAVTLTSTGAITTAGAAAHGVYAQSLGGGGGTGGFAVTGSLSKGATTASIGIALGGDGGAGSQAGAVDVTAGGMIRTSGDGAYGVMGQSAGGGGGSGGFAGALTGQASSGRSLSFSVALGGSGGTGATGSTALVTSSADIFTSGADAYGVVSQSLGGGGGTGGFALTAALGGSKAINFGFSLGGTGGIGASSALAHLVSTGNVTTRGLGGIGLFAQSVGGGGGAGGAAGALSVSGSEAINVTLGLGGKGAVGAVGGQVLLENQGSVTTSGEYGHAIMAESVGGGGGHGGMAGLTPDDLTDGAGGAGSVGVGDKNKNIAFTLGGKGGAGADASLVHVINSGSAVTAGAIAHGLYAHSIGGGGGDAGLATSMAAAVGKGSNSNISLAFGGDGGMAGNGGAVQVENTGSLTTSGDGAYGLFAFSVGGGGGAGGDARGWAMGLQKTKNEEKDKLTEIEVSVGGKGGASGDGGAVSVSNSGVIITRGGGSDGLHAKSVGGGGGAGGNVSTSGGELATIVGLMNKAEPNANAISIGGSGGASGDGGAVTVVNTGSVATYGAIAQGVFAQSVGGGGGTGGSGLPGRLSVGGGGGASGDGGVVKVTNDGAILTRGASSAGIFAQSIGGGGGVGGATDETPPPDPDNAPPDPTADAGAVTGPSDKAVADHQVNWRDWLAFAYDKFGTALESHEVFKSFKKDERHFGLGIGGSGGAAGNGAAVTVTNQGSIETFGDNAPGIFAQSVGGGGGVGGVGALTECCILSVSGAGGAAGTGGAITISNVGDIATHGYGSYGIFAQSIGGGGGLAGDTSLGLADAGDLSKVGGPDYSGVGSHKINWADGMIGDGGAVTVTNTGRIVLTGAGAIGIFAQSVGGGGGLLSLGNGLGGAGSLGGEGAGGTVTIVQHGDVLTPGVNGIAAFVQSASAGRNGDLDITFDGALSGGGTLGVGARIDGGHTNTLNFLGVVQARSGNAIIASGGDDTVHARAGVIGNVDLGSGQNAMINHATSIFESADHVKLNGGLLTNDGRLSPGGLGKVQLTAVAGSFTQGPGGILQSDLDLSRTDLATDRIVATGGLDLQGGVRVSVLNIGKLRSGQHSASLLQGGAISRSTVTLEAPQTAVATYALATRANSLDLTYGVDFAPAGGLRPNGGVVGRYFNAITADGAPEALQPVIAQLFALTRASDLAKVYESLTPEAYLDQAAASAFALERFSDSMMSCPTSTDQVSFSQDGCIWVKVSDRRLKLSATANNLGFEERSGALAGGFERQVTPNLRLGLGLSAEDLQTGVPGLSDGKGKRYGLGVVAKTILKGVDLAVAGSIGSSNLETRRIITLPAGQLTALGDQDLRFAALTARASHRFGDDHLYARPVLELNLAQARTAAMSETGAGPLGLAAPGQTQRTASLSPRLEFGGEVAAKGVSLRPFVRLGVTQVLSRPDPLFSAAFVAAPAVAGQFTIKGQTDRLTRDAELGVQVVTSNGLSARLAWSGRYGDRTASETLSLKLTLPF